MSRVELYEIKLEADHGHVLRVTSSDVIVQGAEEWSGWRMRYRRKGARRWTKFVVLDGVDLGELTPAQLQEVAATHERTLYHQARAQDIGRHD